MKFILTRELGRLARWMRILGFDTVYFQEGNLSSLVIQALKEERVILTRNQRLPRGRGMKIVAIKKEKLEEQIKGLMQDLRIKPDEAKMFSRCILCNSELVEVSRDKVKEKVPEYVFKTQQEFIQCPLCARIYWQGTHWGKVKKILETLKYSGH